MKRNLLEGLIIMIFTAFESLRLYGAIRVRMMKSVRMFVSKRLSEATVVGENYKRVNTTAIILQQNEVQAKL